MLLSHLCFIKYNCVFLKDDTLHSFKKSAFCHKRAYFMNKGNPPPPGGNFAGGAV